MKSTANEGFKDRPIEKSFAEDTPRDASVNDIQEKTQSFAAKS